MLDIVYGLAFAFQVVFARVSGLVYMFVFVFTFQVDLNMALVPNHRTNASRAMPYRRVV